MSRYNPPQQQEFDSNGDPLVGAKLFFFESGTSTLKSIYADSSFTTPIDNPAISNEQGRFPNIFLDGLYRVVLQDSSGVSIWPEDADPVGEIAAGQFESWASDATYDIPDIVKGSDNEYYRSITNSNQGNDPTSSPANWELLSFGAVWNAAVTYAKGNTAFGSDGKLYTSAIDSNLNNNPISDSLNWTSYLDPLIVSDTTDPTKQIAIDAAGTTGTKTTVTSSQTTDRTLTLPDATDTLVGRDTTDTLTNKTLTAPQINNGVLSSPSLTDPVLTNAQINDTSLDHQYIIAVSELSADRTITLPLLAGNDTFTFNAFTATLTNKTLNLSSNTLSGTTAQFNTALSDGDFLTLAGTESPTNKTIDLTDNTLTGTSAEFNTALSDDNFAFIGVSNAFSTNQAIESASNSYFTLKDTDTTASSTSYVSYVQGTDSVNAVTWLVGRDQANTTLRILNNVTNGDVNIVTIGTGRAQSNGNDIYYATGADVPITDGGTGASTATDARANLISGIAQGQVGSYAILAKATANTTITAGDSVAGSGLRYASVSLQSGATTNVGWIGTDQFGATPSGTWLAMSTTGPADANYYPTALFVRTV